MTIGLCGLMIHMMIVLIGYLNYSQMIIKRKSKYYAYDEDGTLIIQCSNSNVAREYFSTYMEKKLIGLDKS